MSAAVGLSSRSPPAASSSLLGARPPRFWARGALVDWPTYQRYGDAILDHGLVPTATSPSSTRPARCRVRRCRAALRRLRRRVRVGDGRLRRRARRRRRARSGGEAALYVALAPLLAGSLILSRFDLWPALLTVAALAALLAERHRLGWGLLGAAVAAKLWPLVARAARARVVVPRRAGSARRSSGVAVAAVVVRAVRDRRAARPVGQHQRPGLAAAADREPRRVALHHVRRTRA